MDTLRPVLVLIAVLSATTGGCSRSGNQDRETLTVSVAASLQNAMKDLAPVYERSHPGITLNFNFGGSGALEQQIESGAPVDVFFAAAPRPIDQLASTGLIPADTRRDLLRNQLVLVVPRGNMGPNSFQELADAKVKLIALGEPATVPAGDYGRQVLESLHIWKLVQPKVVLAKDVRQALSYVETGNADAGIVYATDARESQSVRVTSAAPAGRYAPVIYPVAVVKTSHNATAATRIGYVSGRT